MDKWLQINYNVWDEITYPFLNFNGFAVEVWEWISNFGAHRVYDYLTMLGLKLIHVSKIGPLMFNRYEVSQRKFMDGLFSHHEYFQKEGLNITNY